MNHSSTSRKISSVPQRQHPGGRKSRGKVARLDAAHLHAHRLQFDPQGVRQRRDRRLGRQPLAHLGSAHERRERVAAGERGPVGQAWREGVGLVQEPAEGEPATEQTEVWVFYDATNVYVAFRCWESDPTKAVANEMRRDSGNIVRVEGVIDKAETATTNVTVFGNPID